MSDVIIGYAACLVAGLLFGCMFVPVKKYDSADGLVVQWVMCAAIFCVGFIVNAVRSAPQFYHLAMLGGALWAAGNVMAVPIIHMIGMGLGMMIWSSSCLLAGWASGRFGWFGMNPQVPLHPLLNYLGVVISVISAVLFMFVKPSDNSSNAPAAQHADFDGRVATTEDQCLSDKEDEEAEIDKLISKKLSDESAIPKRTSSCSIPPTVIRITGIVLSLISGVFYGLTFAPVIYIQDHRNDTDYPLYMTATNDGLDYVFAHFTGIFVTSTVFFVAYCLITRNRPVVNPQILLPSFIAGAMWAVAQVSFFVANDKLQAAITFPIITRLPGCVAALFGIFYFREITGKRNLFIMFVATCVTIIAGILSGLSNTEL